MSARTLSCHLGRSVLTFLFALAGHRGAIAQEHANIARGAGRSGSDGFAEVDSVNRFNGNLSLAIPLGLSYPVDANLSYSLTLVYNSQVWEQEEVQDAWGTTYIRSKSLRTNNAGLGWMLSLGRLSFAGPQGLDTARNTYLGPDGSRHTFYASLHEEETPVSGMEYSRDGSYLRLRTAVRKVEFPDGAVHEFDNEGYPIAFRDSFGNTVTISYRDLNDNPTSSASALQWWLNDRHSRTQKIIFKQLFGTTVVDRVVLSAFGGSSATWTFRYNLEDGQGVSFEGCEDTDPAWVAGFVPLLTRLTLPDSTTYEMPTSEYWENSPGSGNEPCRTGFIKSAKLPTLGRVAWTYSKYTYPAGSASPRPYWERKAGVSTRQLIEADGSNAGLWAYSTALVQGSGGVPAELRNELLDPLGHNTRRYFSVCSNAVFCPNGSLQEYGLPISRVQPTDTDGRFLSAEVLANGTTLARSSYLTFDRDTPSTNPSLIDQQRFNQRISSSNTIFRDDADRYFKTVNSDFDGLGHYRSQVQTTNVAGTTGSTLSRTRLRNFNPGGGTYPGIIALPGNPWILGTFDLDEVTEGGQSVTATYCFDDTTGALTRRRLLRGFNRDETNQDTVERFVRNDGHGNVTDHDFFGGRFQATIPEAAPGALTNLCNMSLPASPEFAFRHTYSAGALASSSYLNVSPPLLQRSIDSRTGLPSGEYDPSGAIFTSLTYDTMGRLTRIQPQSGHDGRTQIDYGPATGPGWGQTARVTVLEKTNSGASTLTTSVQKLDFFGRPFRVERTMPGGATATRVTEYGFAGEVTRFSEWQDGTPSSWTYFLDYDPFGRPGRVRPPDAISASDPSRDIVLAYTGIREIARSVPMATTASSETEVTRRELYDGWGRLRQVVEPSGANGSNVTTTYTYDAGSRLTSASTPTGGSPQTRSWSYNAAGMLLQEVHPEVGSAVTYDGHDSRGNVWRRTTGSVTLESQRDNAERLLLVKEAFGSQRTLKEFTYGTTNDGANLRAGKLVSQSRSNFVELAGTPYRAELRDTFVYAGRGGRLSARTLDHYLDNLADPEPPSWNQAFTQGWAWDELGNASQVAYPVCTHPGCSPGSNQLFDDVPKTHPVRAEIEGLALAGITAGCSSSPPNYCPDISIARQQMAVFLVKASSPPGYLPPECTTPTFGDVPCSSSFARWVEELARRGITGGCGGGSFCPTSPVTNEQMAVFLLRSLEGGTYAPAACDTPSFADVPCSSGYARWIEELANRGITTGCGGGLYCPQANVTRGQMAQLMIPTFGIPARIQPTTARTVLTSFSQGLPSAVGTVANSTQYANQITYHPSGMLATLRHANSPGALANESWVTDTVGLPASFQPRPASFRSTGRLGTATLWDTGAYGYDASGQIKAIGAGAFVYDKVGRLTSGTSFLEPVSPSTPRTQTAEYDRFGNLTTLTTHGQGLSFNPSPTTNRLGGAVTYDDRGNLTSWNGNGYAFGPFDELWLSTSAETWIHLYDAADERTFSFNTATGATRWTLRDLDGRVLREFSAGAGNPWTVAADWIWRGSQLLALETPRGVRHLHLDHLGSPRLVTNRQGKASAFHLFHPFGKEATAFDQDDLRAKYTGHERDLGVLTSDADDLDYLHARFYNGQLARFLSVDRLQGSPHRPQSLNRYAYVLGSPINYVDPWGLEATFSCSGTTCTGTVDAVVNRHNNPLDDNFDRIDASNPEGGGVGGWGTRFRRGSRIGGAFSSLGLRVAFDFSLQWSSCLNGWDLGPGNDAFCMGALGAIGSGFGTASMASLRSTASSSPRSLMDDMVLAAAKKGAGRRIIESLGDPRFKGMEKWQYTERSSSGLRSTVHYVRDPKTGELLDFKFVHHAELP